MTSALRYEWRRLTTLRSTWWLIGIGSVLTLGLALLVGIGIAAAGDVSDGNDFVVGAIATQGAAIGVAPLLVTYVMALSGVFCFGHEYRHGMIRATLTAVPSRVAVFAAKAVVTGLTAAVVGAVVTGIGILLALICVDELTVDAGLVGQLLGGVAIYTGLFSLVGLAFASLLRNQVAALVSLLVAPLVLESVVRAVLVVPEAFDDVEFLARYLPFDAGSQLYVQLTIGDALQLFGFEPLGAVAGGVTFGIFTALLLVAAGALFVRRDA